jgi:hypothetical protein
MLTYKNIQRHDDIDFKDYLKIGGYSHSWLKHQKNGICPPMYVTDNMKVGSLVDNILTEPKKADMSSPFYPGCKDIAFRIKENFGDMIKAFQKQISYTADIQHKEWVMKTTGRLDFLLPKHCVVDLKCTQSKDVKALIAFMGYENQVWHYCKMAGVEKAYLMVYSIPNKKTEIFYLDCSSNFNQFWANKVMDFGSVK